jgi:hypothetical protein
MTNRSEELRNFSGLKTAQNHLLGNPAAAFSQQTSN